MSLGAKKNALRSGPKQKEKEKRDVGRGWPTLESLFGENIYICILLKEKTLTLQCALCLDTAFRDNIEKKRKRKHSLHKILKEVIKKTCTSVYFSCIPFF